MSRDTIGDFLTIIRNGVAVSKLSVSVPYSKMKHKIASILQDEGFVRDVVVEGDGSCAIIKIFLKYVDGESVIHEIKRISAPGLRVYSRSSNIKPVIGGLGVSVVSTSGGLMTHKKARSLAMGGEVICTVW